MPTLIDLGGGLVVDRDKQLLALDRLDCEESLADFVRHFWHVVEPSTPLLWGWAIDAICEHLEAVTYGDITRLLINVPPGSMKSLLCNVFWPAWEWIRFPHLRYLSFSYAAHLTERDNRRFRDILISPRYQAMFKDRFILKKKGEENVSNDKTGFKVATSIGGVGTGERGNRVLFDDPHSVADAESDVIRKGTVEFFASAMSNRLSDMEKSAIIVIMQRVHEEDVSGYILEKDLGYEHLCIPAEYEQERHCVTSIGWEDPRAEPSETFWENRFPARVLDAQRKIMGPFSFAGQYQQRPDPAGGGIILREWWQLWEDKAFPPFDYIMASLDTAYTEKQENDECAMTVWGIFSMDPTAQASRMLSAAGVPMYLNRSYNETAPKVMLMHAWAERLDFHKLVEKVADSCKRYRVDTLLIENKAAGISCAQEIRRLHGHEGWSVVLSDPKSQDKTARLYSVQHLFADGTIYAPDRAWADKVITQCAGFPRAKHDDLVDTVSQALRKLRDQGLLQRPTEVAAEREDAMKFSGRPDGPLYPG